MASPEYSAVRDAVSRVLNAQLAAAVATNARQHAIDLLISLYARTDTPWGGCCREELQTLLECCATQPRDDAALFQIVSIAPNSLHPSLVAMVAASPIPMVLESRWLRQTTDYDDDGHNDNVTASVLAMGNVVQLHIGVNDDMSLVKRLFQVVHTHSPQLRRLSLSHDPSDLEDADRAKAMQVIARGLFGPDSTLRLEKLKLRGGIDERDLRDMIAVFDPGAPLLRDTVRHRKMVLREAELATIRGTTLAQLLQLSGGVESVKLGPSHRKSVRVAEIHDLVRGCRSLRSLVVQTSCLGWKKMPPVPARPRAADDNIETSQLKSLELRLVDRKPVLIFSGVERLLGHIGRSLVTLRILSKRWRVTVKSSLATVIAQQCPNLEELAVKNAAKGFLEQLFDAYTTLPCRLTRLTLVTGRIDVTYDALITVLSSPIHPVTRTLRSLYIDVRHCKDDSVAPLASELQNLLKNNNSRLRDLTLRVPEYSHVGDDNDDDMDDASRVGGWSVHLPPLRQRLAALSVLRQFNLPVSLLASILSLAGRRRRRYRVRNEHKYDSDGDSAEEDEKEVEKGDSTDEKEANDDGLWKRGGDDRHCSPATAVFTPFFSFGRADDEEGEEKEDETKNVSEQQQHREEYTLS